MWSEPELVYIARWYTNAVEDIPGNCNNMASRCLSAIRADPSARPIFHQLHVVDSARLRNGIERFQKLAAKGVLIPAPVGSHV